MAGPSITWGTCTLCGDAVPAGTDRCPTCGHLGAVREGERVSLPRRQRWRFRSIQTVRVSLVVGIVLLLAYLLVSAVATGPPTFSDPLTTAGTHRIAPGTNLEIAGAITGEDYIVGNFTVVDPAGALVTLLVMNDSEYAAFLAHGSERPLQTYPAASGSRIVFAAPYTDTFHFVFENLYPAASGLWLTVYVATNYESNVVLG